jgi:hypothetical protein
VALGHDDVQAILESRLETLDEMELKKKSFLLEISVISKKSKVQLKSESV